MPALKWIIPILAVLYALSPYDLLPDLFVGWGWLDDLVLLAKGYECAVSDEHFCAS